jgi:hypothetical protein
MVKTRRRKPTRKPIPRGRHTIGCNGNGNGHQDGRISAIEIALKSQNKTQALILDNQRSFQQTLERYDDRRKSELRELRDEHIPNHTNGLLTLLREFKVAVEARLTNIELLLDQARDQRLG